MSFESMFGLKVLPTLLKLVDFTMGNINGQEMFHPHSSLVDLRWSSTFSTLLNLSIVAPATIWVTTTLIIPISLCYYSKLPIAITSYLGVQFFLSDSSIGCLEIIVHK